MNSRTPQQVADELLSLQAKAVNIVQGTIAGAANPGGRIGFTYTNPIDGQTYTAEGVAWNVCSPSQVSALKLEDGSWVVVGAHESATVREVIHTDRRANPKPISKTGSMVMWLDANWIQNDNFAFTYRSANVKAFGDVVSYFLRGRSKTIYTLVEDARLYRQSGFNLDSEIAAKALSDNNVTVVEVTRISQAKGLFFLPLLAPDARLTPGEFDHLRSLAPKGLLITGEWSLWAAKYNDHLLRGLKVRPGVTTVDVPDIPAYAYELQKGLVFSAPALIGGNAYGRFIGLRDSEKLAIAQGTDHAVFALLKTS